MTRRPFTLLRLDGGGPYGLGRLARGAALGSVLHARHGHAVLAAVEGGIDGVIWLRRRGTQARLVHPGTQTPASLGKLVGGQAADVLVLDVARPMAAAELAALRRVAKHIVLLDDAGPGSAAADLAVCPVLAPGPRVAGRRKGRLLWGAEWVIVDPGLRRMRARKGAAGAGPRVVVSLGGRDPEGLTPLVVEALDELSAGFTGVVVVGPASTCGPAVEAVVAGARNRWEIAREPQDLAQVLAGADVAVLRFGTTAYECAVLGVPTVLLCGRPEDVVAAERLAAAGAAVSLGLWEYVRPSELRAAVQRLLGDARRRQAMAAAARRTIDGRGAERLAVLVARLAAGEKVAGAGGGRR